MKTLAIVWGCQFLRLLVLCGIERNGLNPLVYSFILNQVYASHPEALSLVIRRPPLRFVLNRFKHCRLLCRGICGWRGGLTAFNRAVLACDNLDDAAYNNSDNHFLENPQTTISSPQEERFVEMLTYQSAWGLNHYQKAIVLFERPTCYELICLFRSMG